MINAATKQQQDFGVFIRHHFMYAKETRIPSGVSLEQHKHKYAHYSLLVSGRVLLEKNAEKFEFTAPALITIDAGIPHKVTAITDVEWWCVHETDERDVSKIDETLIA